jgi:hypothetical protein
MIKAIERLRLANTSRPVDVIKYWQEERYLLLNPPYQRGDVWGSVRQRNLIKSILRGIPIPSLIVNDRFAAGWGEEIAVIDGKQRMTAILDFMSGKLSVPGEWFGLPTARVAFGELPIAMQRRFGNNPIQVTEGQLKTLEAEIEVFELVNYGGVPQGQSDFDE